MTRVELSEKATTTPRTASAPHVLGLSARGGNGASIRATPADVQRAVVEHGHSRYVVTDDKRQPSGYLHLKDVMDIQADRFDDPVPNKRIRRLIAVPRDTEIEDAMARMRRHGAHVARTVDTDGETIGVLFLEDVLEVLIGEVNDATDAA